MKKAFIFKQWAAAGGIQTRTTTDAGVGLNVCRIDANDWLAYNLSVTQTLVQLPPLLYPTRLFKVALFNPTQATPMPHYYLYGTLGCHLCELAQALLAPWQQGGHITLTLIDIADNPEWVERYGIHIPVLQAQASQESLYWPFDPHSLQAFLQKT